MMAADNLDLLVSVLTPAQRAEYAVRALVSYMAPTQLWQTEYFGALPIVLGACAVLCLLAAHNSAIQ